MTQIDFIPTRAVGLSRLETFAPDTGRHYASTRNFDFGPEDRGNVSALSPWIRHRLVTEEETVRASLSHLALSTADKFIAEVCWRTYWKGWLEHRPKVWSDYCEGLAAALIANETQADKAAAFEAAITGQTGITCFDVWSQELITQGYLANHTRMWFASIWIFTLRLPWELGADFFLRHLIDGDAASNTLSWRWVAGLHTPGKTYLARPANIEKYTKGRFTPTGLTTHDRVIAGTLNPDPKPRLPGQTLAKGKLALLLTEEDLHPESWPLKDAEITAVAGLCFPEARSPNPIGKYAETFTRTALKNSVSRAAQHFGAPHGDLSSPAALADWFAESGADTLMTTLPPIGWVRPELDALKAGGLPLVYVERAWDTAFWPHATKGFFALKKEIPATLAKLGILKAS